MYHLVDIIVGENHAFTTDHDMADIIQARATHWGVSQKQIVQLISHGLKTHHQNADVYRMVMMGGFK